MKKDFKYWILIFSVCYGLTILVELLLRPFWFVKSEEHTDLAIFQMFFTIILLPIILVTTIYYLTKKFDKEKLFLIPAILVCSCIYISAQLGFINWADSIGSRTNPDSETLMVVAFEWQVGLIVTLIGLTICFVRIHKKKKIAVSQWQDKACHQH